MQSVRRLDALGMDDLDEVGSKNASLGEMISHLTQAGVRVPGGFVTTAEAFREFLSQDGRGDRIQACVRDLDVDDVRALAACGSEVREWIMQTPLPSALEREIRAAWKEMTRDQGTDFSVAVRSSATAEDLPEASFAGQQETYLNVCGIDAGIDALSVRVAVHRSSDRVQGPSRIRRRARVPVSRDPAHGAQRRGSQRRHVHVGYRVWLR